MNVERPAQPQDSLGAPGAQLKVQREAMGWTVEYVADQLKLAPRQIVALEEDDFAHLPNLAVVRGFVRAYAKVVKLDPAPLVAMIDIHPVASPDVALVRREVLASFSETRFPSLTQRSSRPVFWIISAVVVVIVIAAFGAYRAGLISPALLTRSGKAAEHAIPAAGGDKPGIDKPAPAAVIAPVETTLIKQSQGQGQDLAAPPSTSVPLISVPPSSASGAPAATGNALVLNVRQDSWIEIRRAGAAPLISRLVKAGSSETFDIGAPALLIVGNPSGVSATLRGAVLELPAVAGSTTTRLSIK